MRQSLREYIPFVLHRWWAMVAFAFGDILGIITTLAGKAILLPSWAWFTIGTVALFIAMFLAFHEVRVERDEVKGGIDSIIKELRNLKVTVGNEEKNAATILYECREQLVHGLNQYPSSQFGNPHPDFYLVAVQLDIMKVIRLEQRRGDEGWDYGYWVPTDLGREVVKYLGKGQPISQTVETQKESLAEKDYWEHFGPKYEVVKADELLLEKDKRGYKMILPVVLKFKNGDDRKRIWIDIRFAKVGFDTILKDGRSEPYELQNEGGKTLSFAPSEEIEIEIKLVAYNFEVEPVLKELIQCHWVSLGTVHSTDNAKEKPLKLLENFNVKVHSIII